jgi:hypothetical protein
LRSVGDSAAGEVSGGGCSPHRTGLSPCIWGECREIFAKCRETDIASLLKATRSQHLEYRLPTQASREEQGEPSLLSKVVDLRAKGLNAVSFGVLVRPEMGNRSNPPYGFEPPAFSILGMSVGSFGTESTGPEEGPSRRQPDRPFPFSPLRTSGFLRRVECTLDALIGAAPGDGHRVVIKFYCLGGSIGRFVKSGLEWSRPRCG